MSLYSDIPAQPVIKIREPKRFNNPYPRKQCCGQRGQGISHGGNHGQLVPKIYRDSSKAYPDWRDHDNHKTGGWNFNKIYSIKDNDVYHKGSPSPVKQLLGGNFKPALKYGIYKDSPSHKIVT